MLVTISLYGCITCGTFDCEYEYSWNMYGDELCNYRMQMSCLWSLICLGGATGIGPSTRQGHPTGGTSRWLPPPPSITLVSKVKLLQKIYYCIILNVNCHEWLYEYYEESIVALNWMLNYYEMFVWVLQRIYCCVILNAKLSRNVYMSITKNLLCYTKC
jgi:hypothetical protein